MDSGLSSPSRSELLWIQVYIIYIRSSFSIDSGASAPCRVLSSWNVRKVLPKSGGFRQEKSSFFPHHHQRTTQNIPEKEISGQISIFINQPPTRHRGELTKKKKKHEFSLIIKRQISRSHLRRPKDWFLEQ